MKTTRTILRAGLLATLMLAGCSSHDATSSISKVQMFHMRTVAPPATPDRMIQSETRRRMWGAISNAERVQRLGNYYTAHWETGDTTTPVTVQIEYRQAKTGAKITKQEVRVDAPRKKNKTEFQITGQPYLQFGRVVAWRIQVIQGGQIIGQETSFLWD